ncbi:DMT family transporter [Hyphomicrobium sp.]|uniref:DMT family transporter n=1 Tax=Hyphomicrobium sp. TaxID=82 RepID=UPI003F6E9639
MSWIYLLLAGVLEVAFTTAIRYTDGFTRPLPILLVLSLAALSFACVAKSTASIPLGTAYAVWGGLGVIGTASVGILFFNEPVAVARLVFLTLLVASIAGLKLSAA